MHSISVLQATGAVANPPSPNRANRLMRRTGPSSVYVIGGAFGTGKTTLLDRLVREALAAGARPAVVLSDLSGAGRRSVDIARLQMAFPQGGVEIRPVATGCACCDSSQSLADEVAALVRAGRGPIFVETTGGASLGDAGDAVAEVLRHSRLRGRLVSVVAVVDARLPGTDVEGADTVVVNKVDGLDPRQVEGAVRVLARHNPTARIFETSFGMLTLEELAKAKRCDIGRSSSASLRKREAAVGLEAVTAEMLGPVITERLAGLLRDSPGIVRLKGFARTTGAWGVQELQWTAAGLEVRPAGRTGRTSLQLSIVGRGIDWEVFVDALDACVASPA